MLLARMIVVKCGRNISLICTISDDGSKSHFYAKCSSIGNITTQYISVDEVLHAVKMQKGKVPAKQFVHGIFYIWWHKAVYLFESTIYSFYPSLLPSWFFYAVHYQ